MSLPFLRNHGARTERERHADTAVRILTLIE